MVFGPRPSHAKPDAIESCDGDAERLVAHDAWLRSAVARHLKLPPNSPHLVGQCANLLEFFPVELARLGVKLNEQQLRGALTKLLEDVGRRQAQDEVAQLFPYLRSAVIRHARGNIEEWRSIAAKAAASRMLSKVVARQSGSDRTLTELCGIRHDERLLARAAAVRKRQRDAKRSTTDGQLSFFRLGA